MNLNGLVLENVKESYYYKNHLVEIDTAQQLLDEVFYKVSCRITPTQFISICLLLRLNISSRGKKEREKSRE